MSQKTAFSLLTNSDAEATSGDCPSPAEIIPHGVSAIGVPAVWPHTEGAGVKFAILSTGVDLRHPEFAQTLVEAVSFVNGEPDPTDLNGSGSFTAGLVAAARDNAGVVGSAPRVSLFSVKVLGANGSGYVSEVVAGLEWCRSKAIHVVYLPFGGTHDEQMEAACGRLYAQGTLIVGTERMRADHPIYPAAYDSVLSTGASRSSQNISAEIYAPTFIECGVRPGGGYTRYPTYAGTSVAGVACLTKSAFPALSGSTLRQRLIDTATPTPGFPDRPEVNAKSAVGVK